jgi:hypothetical protein
VLSLEATVSSLPLSQTSSEIRFGDRNLHFLETPPPPPPLMTADNRIFSSALLFTEQSVYSNSNEIIK